VAAVAVMHRLSDVGATGPDGAQQVRWAGARWPIRDTGRLRPALRELHLGVQYPCNKEDARGATQRYSEALANNR